jgi:hypothetical protein
MSRLVSVFVIGAWVAFGSIIAINFPWVLDDENSFFKDFISHEMIDFMGIIVTITLASVTNILVELIKLERELKLTIFEGSRNDLRHSAFALIISLAATFILVAIKPLISRGETAQAFVNGFGILIIIFSLLILLDITLAAFQLRPNIS